MDDIPPTTQHPDPAEDPAASQLSPPASIPSPPRRRRRSTARIVRPAKDSLYDLLHQHQGTSLFVRPFCWTDQHATLLGARFCELPRCDTPLPSSEPGSPPSRDHLRPSPAIKTLSSALGEMLRPAAGYPATNPRVVTAVLSTLWPASFSGKPQISPDLHLFFGDRVYRDAARAPVMWHYPASNSQSDSSPTSSTSGSPIATDLPMLCYLNREALLLMRSNLFRVVLSPGRAFNEPVYSLQRARSKALLPANLDHDVQFTATFLAMAQRHFYPPPAPASRRDTRWWTAKGSPPRPDFKDIKLRILTHDTESADFILYTGHVTAKFLDRFHEPSKIPLGDDGRVPGLDIEYTRIPIWPILGLRERLGKALGTDIVGPFDPTVMETWDNDEGEKTCPTSGKRKRGALSEVFNGSFEEGTDDEAERLGVKSRRLGKGSRVGIVA